MAGWGSGKLSGFGFKISGVNHQGFPILGLGDYEKLSPKKTPRQSAVSLEPTVGEGEGASGRVGDEWVLFS